MKQLHFWKLTFPVLETNIEATSNVTRLDNHTNCLPCPLKRSPQASFPNKSTLCTQCFTPQCRCIFFPKIQDLLYSYETVLESKQILAFSALHSAIVCIIINSSTPLVPQKLRKVGWIVCSANRAGADYAGCSEQNKSQTYCDCSKSTFVEETLARRCFRSLHKLFRSQSDRLTTGITPADTRRLPLEYYTECGEGSTSLYKFHFKFRAPTCNNSAFVSDDSQLEHSQNTHKIQRCCTLVNIRRTNLSAELLPYSSSCKIRITANPQPSNWIR